MLDERKSAILRAVIDEYIATAQPVGSKHVVGERAIDVSAATVRADMAALEREGYLTHPHTSAGRVPTDKGYRFFVDYLCEPGKLGVAQQHRLREFFSHTHGELERMLRDTSTLLSGLTDYAAVVVAPARAALVVRQALLVPLGPRSGLLVVVLSDGAVEKYAIELNDEDDTRVGEVSAHLHAHLINRSLGRVDDVLLSGDPTVDRLINACLGALSLAPEPAETDQVYVGGTARMAEAFEAVETVRSVLTILEQSVVVVSLLKDVVADGRNVSIGAENGIEPLSECSLVVAPYEGGSHVSGTIGVLGPTRMDYAQALAAVAAVGQSLSRQLAEG